MLYHDPYRHPYPYPPMGQFRGGFLFHLGFAGFFLMLLAAAIIASVVTLYFMWPNPSNETVTPPVIADSSFQESRLEQLQRNVYEPEPFHWLEQQSTGRNSDHPKHENYNNENLIDTNDETAIWFWEGEESNGQYQEQKAPDKVIAPKRRQIQRITPKRAL